MAEFGFNYERKKSRYKKRVKGNTKPTEKSTYVSSVSVGSFIRLRPNGSMYQVTSKNINTVGVLCWTNDKFYEVDNRKVVYRVPPHERPDF